MTLASASTSAAPRSPVVSSTRTGTILEELRVESPADRRGGHRGRIAGLVAELRADHESRRSASARRATSTSRARRCMFAPNLAWRDEPTQGRAGEARRPAGGDRERRERRRLGRVPLRRRRRTSTTCCWSPSARRRRRASSSTAAAPRGVRRGRRDRPHARGARRADLCGCGKQRLLGAVRQRHRAGPRGRALARRAR